MTAPKTSPETPHLSSRLSPTAQMSATSFFTSILSMSPPDRPFSCLRVIFTSLLWTRNATDDRVVDMEYMMTLISAILSMMRATIAGRYAISAELMVMIERSVLAATERSISAVLFLR